MALPRYHHNGLTTHFLLNIIINWYTYTISTTPPRRCHYSKTSQHPCYFGNNKGDRGSVKKSQNFDIVVHQQFLDAVRWNGNHRCCHLATVALVIPLQYKWQCHCRWMPLVASLESSRSLRIPGPLMNIQRVSATQQSTVGPLTDINSAL